VRPRGLASLMDAVPTVAELAGVPLASNPERQSVSLVRALEGNGDAALRPYVLAETFAFSGKESGAGAYVAMDRFAELGGSANLSIRTPDARYVFRWNDEDEYFDLEADPHEITNLAASPAHGERVRALRSLLVEEVESTDARFAAAVRQRMDAKADGTVALGATVVARG